MLFSDRADAGKRLAAQLQAYADRDDVVILALPRGGVPVGFEVAQALRAPLDVLVVRKLGFPGQEELAMGAIAPGVRILNPDVLRNSLLPSEEVQAVIDRETTELERRQHLYRGNRNEVDVAEKTVVLVDDGLATGASMRAAIASLRLKHAKEIVVAVPVGVSTTCRQIEAEAGRVICLSTPEYFHAVGGWYKDFSQTTDAEVSGLLARSKRQDANYAFWRKTSPKGR